jgi:hypothetical protein
VALALGYRIDEDAARGGVSRRPTGEAANDARRACDACLAAGSRRLPAGWSRAPRAGALPEVLALPTSGSSRRGRQARAATIGAQLEAFDAEAGPRCGRRRGLRAVCRHDDLYPPRLLHARDAPAVLHVAGDLRHLDRLGAEEERTVAIVGTRRASRDGLDVAARSGAIWRSRASR